MGPWLRWKGVEVSGWFLLAAALLLYLDTGGLALPVAAAFSLHELGHWVVIRLLGGRVRKIRIGLAGAELMLDRSRGLSYGRELLCTLAGPGTNFLLAALFVRQGCSLWAGVNWVTGCFQLLPVLPLDGGRGLFCFLCLFVPPERAERWLYRVGMAASVLLLAAGGAVWAATKGNFTLLLVGSWIFTVFGRQKDLPTPV